MRRHRSQDAGHDSWNPTTTSAPGKRTRSERLAPVQRRERPSAATAGDHALYPEPSPAHDEPRPPVSFVDSLLAESDPRGVAGPAGPVQRAAQAGASDTAPGDVHAAAAAGIGGPAGALPFTDVIQRSFGAHDISAIQAHVGGPAAAASRAMGAEAYATGNHVAFARAPDLHTAAHEAAHVVQQRAGVQLKGGVGEVGDVYEQQADAVADAVVRGESAEHLLGAADGAPAVGASVQRSEAPGPAAGNRTSPELIVPDRIEFDDLELGDRQRRETIVWYTGPGEARVERTELTIDKHQRQFQVRKAPTRLVSVRSPAAATMGRLAIDFAPQHEGPLTDTLRLTVAPHAGDGEAQTRSIVLAGRARRPGQPTHAERVAREDGERARADEQAGDVRDQEARTERTERNIKDPRVAPSGRAEAFRARLDEIRDDLRNIDAKRILGIDTVEKEALTFIRKLPPPTMSAWDYARVGAALALTFASHGLARNIATALVSSGARSTPLGIGVGVGPEGQRESTGPLAHRRLIQKALERAIGAGATWAIGATAKAKDGRAEPGRPPRESHSGDPALAFFAAQRIALADSTRGRLSVITALGPELVDQLHDERSFLDVLATLDRVRAELGNVLGGQAVDEQSQATLAQWLAFVAKRSGETHASQRTDGSPAAGIPGADRVANLRPLDERDGVIEIGFGADLSEPGSPARIVSVRLRGVSQVAANRIRTLDLLEARVPIRAVARDLTQGGQPISDAALAVTRNEVGEIDVAAGKPGAMASLNLQARFLAAKRAPERRHEQRDADVRAGARILVEQELAPQWKSTMLELAHDSEAFRLPVETDDDSSRRR